MISKKARIASDCVYGVFVAAVVCFVLIALFGSDEIVNPDAAYTVSRRVQAVVILAAGTLPMTIAAMAVYHDNSVKTSGSPGRNAFFIFLPSIICAVCALGLLLVTAFFMLIAYSINN